MPTTPEIIDLVFNTLRVWPGLAEIKEWNKANGLITLKDPGCSVGLERENYEPYSRDLDEASANLSILLWVKNIDAAAGEAKVRRLAQEARLALTESRTLGGAAADSYVYGIIYTAAEGDKSLILHLAEIDYRVRYYSPRMRPETPAPIETISNDVGREQ